MSRSRRNQCRKVKHKLDVPKMYFRGVPNEVWVLAVAMGDKAAIKEQHLRECYRCSKEAQLNNIMLVLLLYWLRVVQ